MLSKSYGSWAVQKVSEKMAMTDASSDAMHNLSGVSLGSTSDTPQDSHETQREREERAASRARIGNTPPDNCHRHGASLSQRYSVLALRGFHDAKSGDKLPDFPDEFYRTAPGLNEDVFNGDCGGSSNTSARSTSGRHRHSHSHRQHPYRLAPLHSRKGTAQRQGVQFSLRQAAEGGGAHSTLRYTGSSTAPGEQTFHDYYLKNRRQCYADRLTDGVMLYHAENLQKREGVARRSIAEDRDRVHAWLCLVHCGRWGGHRRGEADTAAAGSWGPEGSADAPHGPPPGGDQEGLQPAGGQEGAGLQVCDPCHGGEGQGAAEEGCCGPPFPQGGSGAGAGAGVPPEQLQAALGFFFGQQHDRVVCILTLPGVAVVVADARSAAVLLDAGGVEVLSGVLCAFADSPAVAAQASSCVGRLLTRSMAFAALRRSDVFSNLLHAASVHRRDSPTLLAVIKAVHSYISLLGCHAMMMKFVVSYKGLPLLLASVVGAQAVSDDSGRATYASLVLWVAKLVLVIAQHHDHALPTLVASQTVHALIGLSRAMDPSPWELRYCLVRIVGSIVAKYRRGRTEFSDQGIQSALLDSILEASVRMSLCAEDGANGVEEASRCGSSGGQKRPASSKAPEEKRLRLKEKSPHHHVSVGARPPPSVADDSFGHKVVTTAVAALRALCGNPSERCCTSLTHSAPVVFESLATACGALTFNKRYYPAIKSVVRKLQNAVPLVNLTALSLRLHPILYSEFRPSANLELTHRIGLSLDEGNGVRSISALYAGLSRTDGASIVVRCILVPVGAVPLTESLPHLRPVEQFTSEISQKCSLWHPALLNFAWWSATECVPVLPGDEVLRAKHYAFYAVYRGGTASHPQALTPHTPHATAGHEQGTTNLRDHLADQRAAAVSGLDALRLHARHAKPGTQQGSALHTLLESLGGEGAPQEKGAALRLVALGCDAVGAEPAAIPHGPEALWGRLAGVLCYSDFFDLCESVCSGLAYLEAARVRRTGAVSSDVIWRSEAADTVPLQFDPHGCHFRDKQLVWKLQWGESVPVVQQLQGQTRHQGYHDSPAPPHVGVAGFGDVMVDMLMYSSETAALMFYSCGAVDAALPALLLNALVAPCFGRTTLTDVTAMAPPPQHPVPVVTAARLLHLLRDLRELCRVTAYYDGDPDDLPGFAHWLKAISAQGASCDGDTVRFAVLPSTSPEAFADLLAGWDVESSSQIPKLGDNIPVF